MRALERLRVSEPLFVNVYSDSSKCTPLYIVIRHLTDLQKMLVLWWFLLYADFSKKNRDTR